jgi:hypothetical protein
MSIDTEFVMTAPEVLHERVTTHDHAGAAVTFESAHRSQSRLESAVIRFDPIVRILLDVMERRRDELIDRSS